MAEAGVERYYLIFGITRAGIEGGERYCYSRDQFSQVVRDGERPPREVICSKQRLLCKTCSTRPVEMPQEICELICSAFEQSGPLKVRNRRHEFEKLQRSFKVIEVRTMRKGADEVEGRIADSRKPVVAEFRSKNGNSHYESSRNPRSDTMAQLGFNSLKVCEC
jgi:hypothetical protein